MQAFLELDRFVLKRGVIQHADMPQQNAVHGTLPSGGCMAGEGAGPDPWQGGGVCTWEAPPSSGTYEHHLENGSL